MRKKFIIAILISAAISLCLIALSALAVKVTLQTNPELAASTRPECVTLNEWEMLQAINKDRYESFKDPLVLSPVLQAEANKRAQGIVRSPSQMRPDSPTGLSVEDISVAHGGEAYLYGYYGPNYAYGELLYTPSSRQVVLDQVYHKDSNGAYIDQYNGKTLSNKPSKKVETHLWLDDDLDDEREGSCVGLGHASNLLGKSSWVMLTAGGIEGVCEDTVPSSISISKDNISVPTGTDSEDFGAYIIVNFEGTPCAPYGTCYIPISSADCGGFDKYRPGEQNAYVQWHGVSCDFKINFY